jgi:thiol-disulfide isomerase/thioredoxin
MSWTPAAPVTNAAFQGQVYIVNVWGTWCEMCREEHDELLTIAQQKVVPIIGLVYMDKRDNAKQCLRRQVREMLSAGKSDDAIFKFMTDRYGEFVRFAPPLSAKTALIWGAPFFMLLLGGLIIFRVVRQRSRMPLDE